MTKKQLKDQETRDARSRRSDKLGHSRFAEVEPGKFWNVGSKSGNWPYPNGFITKRGHWILTAWGFQGHTLCGATVDFDQDPVIHGQKEQPAMRPCCKMRLLRIQARLGYRKLTWTPDCVNPWHWYVPTDKLREYEKGRIAA